MQAQASISTSATTPQAIYGLDAGADLDALLSASALSKLIWRCRRGMLENDIFLERFFAKYASCLTVRQANGLNALMDLSDNQLLDAHLGRQTLRQLRPELDTPDIQAVLNLLKEKP